MAARKTDRVSAEMVEMALLLNKHEVLSAHDLDRVKALSSPLPQHRRSQQRPKPRVPLPPPAYGRCSTGPASQGTGNRPTSPACSACRTTRPTGA
jgi:hypothetical protein